MEAIRFTVNGQEKSVATEPGRTLLDVLREEFQLTGAKYGCGEGRCGACTVLMNGKRIFSCRTAIEDAAGKKIVTIEGLSNGEQLHPLQQAFMDASAFQCGFCTPGMILSAVQLLSEKPRASGEEITSWMSRNICRCCSYASIHQAVASAAGHKEVGHE
jgi:aerobic-type carbon monoxide dehydrogenase small subunit (CoxS/CutS family)